MNQRNAPVEFNLWGVNITHTEAITNGFAVKRHAIMVLWHDATNNFNKKFIENNYYIHKFDMLFSGTDRCIITANSMVSCIYAFVSKNFISCDYLLILLIYFITCLCVLCFFII